MLHVAHGVACMLHVPRACCALHVVCACCQACICVARVCVAVCCECMLHTPSCMCISRTACCMCNICMPYAACHMLHGCPLGGSPLTTPCPFSPCPHVPTQAVARGRLVAALAVQRGTVTEVTLPVTPAMVPRLRVVAFFQAGGQVVAASWGAPVVDSCGDQVLLGALGHTGSGGGLGAARGAGMYWGEGARNCWEHWNVLGGGTRSCWGHWDILGAWRGNREIRSCWGSGSTGATGNSWEHWEH